MHSVHVADGVDVLMALRTGVVLFRPNMTQMNHDPSASTDYPNMSPCPLISSSCIWSHTQHKEKWLITPLDVWLCSSDVTPIVY